MARYGSNYLSDFGNTFSCVALSSRLIRVNGLSSRTNSSFDLPYLPAIFLDAVEPNAKNCCSLALTPRAVRLYINQTDYLYLQHPFQPTTSEYSIFLNQLASNNLIFLVEQVGEKLTDFYIDYLTKNG